MQAITFPVGGPREPVYLFLRQQGFVMSKYSDKVWTRYDITLNVYGAGSQARITRGSELLADGPLAQAVCSLS